MLRFYWSVGEDIEKRQYENRYGSHFYENVSKDLRKALKSPILQQDAEVFQVIFNIPGPITCASSTK